MTVLSTDGTVTPLSEALGSIISIIIFPLLVPPVGHPTRMTAGRLLEPGLDAAMNKVPFVRVVYNASKLVVKIALIGTEDLQRPVRLETRPGIHMTAFRTGKTTKDGKMTVFMPAVLNITTGFVTEVDLGDIEETNEKAEETLTCVLSAGLVGQNHVNEFNIEVTGESGDRRVSNDE